MDKLNIHGQRSRTKGAHMNSRAYLVHKISALILYQKYRVIYGELKYQTPYRNHHTLPFLKLPRELRDMVHIHTLVLDTPLEMWAENGDFESDHALRDRITKTLRYKVSNERKGQINLGLLRTCKQIRSEAAEVFYGQNDFRFSGKNGHMAVYAYVIKFWPVNFSLMKSMTIGMPYPSEDEGNLSKNWNPRPSHVFDLYDRTPFPYSPTHPAYRSLYKLPNYIQSWCALARLLELGRQLKRLCLVLSDNIKFGVNYRRLWSEKHLRQITTGINGFSKKTCSRSGLRVLV